MIPHSLDTDGKGVLNLARRLKQLTPCGKAQTFTVINTGESFVVLVGDCLPAEVLHIDKNQ